MLVYNVEDRLQEMERRLTAAARHYGVESYKHPIILWSGVDHGALKILGRGHNNREPLTRAPGLQWLEGEMRANQVVLSVPGHSD